MEDETYVALLRNGLLNLHVLNVVTRLNVENTVQVQTGLELADHEVVVGVSLDALDGEATNPRVDLARELVRVGVASLEIERLLSVEGEDLGGRHDVAAVEDGQAGVLIGDLGRLLPGELNGVVDNVVHREVTDTENRREDSAAESTAASNGLILVESEREGLAAEELGDGLLDGRHTGGTTNHLDEVDVVSGELSLSESLLDGSSDALEEGLDHNLQLLTFDNSADIDILHQRLDVHGGSWVGRENLLHLLSSGKSPGPGLGVGADINLEVLLELVGEVLGQSTVEVAATKVTVVGGRLDVELTLAELNNRGSVVGVTDVDEHDPARLLIGVGKVELGDTVSKGGGGGVVDQAKHLETGNLTGVEHGPTLDIGEPGRNADGDIGNGEFQLSRGDVPDLGQVHSHQLGGRELLLLAQVADFGTDLAIDVTESCCVILLLDLNIGIVEGTADKTLEVADSVLQVRGLLCLRSLTEGSASGVESDERPG